MFPHLYSRRCSERRWFYEEAWRVWNLPRLLSPACDCLARVEKGIPVRAGTIEDRGKGCRKGRKRYGRQEGVGPRLWAQAHFERNTARKSAGGWCQRQSRVPSRSRTAPGAAAQSLICREPEEAELGTLCPGLELGVFSALCPPPSESQEQVAPPPTPILRPTAPSSLTT